MRMSSNSSGSPRRNVGSWRHTGRSATSVRQRREGIRKASRIEYRSEWFPITLTVPCLRLSRQARRGGTNSLGRSSRRRRDRQRTPGRVFHASVQSRSPYNPKDALRLFHFRFQPACITTSDQQPLARGAVQSMAPLRRVRSERRRACPPRRDLQPPKRAHHPEPLPRVRAAAQAQFRAPKRHTGELDLEPERRRASLTVSGRRFRRGRQRWATTSPWRRSASPTPLAVM